MLQIFKISRAAACAHAIVQCAVWTVFGAASHAAVIDFEDLTLPGADSAVAESFISGGATFAGAEFFDCCWQGWVKSNSTLNQDLSIDPGTLTDVPAYSPPLTLVSSALLVAQQGTAYLPNSANASNTYAVASLFDSFVQPNGRTANATPIVLPSGQTIVSMAIANTTWAANNMINGDPFGGPFGPADAFTLTITGEQNGVEIGTVDFALATGTNIVDEWTVVSLVSLHGADTLLFSLASTDVGQFGINTPAFIAIDNIVTTDLSAASTAAPEPSALCMLVLSVGMLSSRRWRGSRLRHSE